MVPISRQRASCSQARQKADDLLRRLQAGEAFEPLAQAESDDTGSGAGGGDLGFFGRGAMVPEFDAATFETPVGSFAPVVQTQFGFHVIQVTDERTAGQVPLAEEPVHSSRPVLVPEAVPQRQVEPLEETAKGKWTEAASVRIR